MEDDYLCKQNTSETDVRIDSCGYAWQKAATMHIPYSSIILPQMTLHHTAWQALARPPVVTREVQKIQVWDSYLHDFSRSGSDMKFWWILMNLDKVS